MVLATSARLGSDFLNNPQFFKDNVDESDVVILINKFTSHEMELNHFSSVAVVSKLLSVIQRVVNILA